MPGEHAIPNSVADGGIRVVDEDDSLLADLAGFRVEGPLAGRLGSRDFCEGNQRFGGLVLPLCLSGERKIHQARCIGQSLKRDLGVGSPELCFSLPKGGACKKQAHNGQELIANWSRH